MFFPTLLSRFVGGRPSSRQVRRGTTRARARRDHRIGAEVLEPRVVLSAPDQWLQRGISGGGVLEAPALSPYNPNEIFISTDMSQNFHSKDGGQSWDFYNFQEFVSSHDVNGVQFTSDPQVLFAIDTDNRAFPTPIRSTDAGATWHKPGSAAFPSNWPTTERAWQLFADPNSASRLIVATQDEIYLSLDAGQTFTSVYTYTGTVNASQALGLHVGGALFDGSTIYVGTNAGLLTSTNGASFQVVSVGGIGAGEAIFSFAGASNGTTARLWAVTHLASKIKTPTLPSGTYGAFQNIYSLDVGQANWTVTASGLSPTADLTQLAMAPNDIDTVYVGGQDTTAAGLQMYLAKHTTASGAWNNVFVLQGAGANVVTGFMGPGGHITSSATIDGLTVAVNDSSRVMVSDGWGAHYSTDGGGLWQQVTVPFNQDHAPGTTMSDTESYNNNGINNTTVWWIHWNSPTEIYAAFDDVKWQRSSDGGATWTYGVNGLDQKMENFSLDVHPTTGRMYLSRGRAVAPHDILGLSDLLANLGGGNISYSDDGGANWNVLYDFGNPVNWTAIDPNDPNTMYAGVLDPDPAVGGVYVSHNINAGAAVSFTRLAVQPPGNVGRPHTIEVLDDGTLVLVLTARKYNHDGNSATPEVHSAGSGVFRLDPGASQWTDVSDANMHYWSKDLIIDPHDPTQSTWYVAVSPAVQPIETSSFPSNLPGLYMTTNRGGSWTRVFDQNTDSIAIDPNNPSEAYLASNSDGLWYTSNLRLADGVTINPSPTFTQITSFPHLRPNRVFFNPFAPGEVWIATNGAGMMVGNAATPDRTFEFSAANFSVNENAGSATITVNRSGDNANVMSVDYLISDGTATNGADYTSSTLVTGITGTLTFLSGQSSVTISLPIFNDSQVEGNQTILLSLSGPIGGNFLGPNANATLTILDDDTVPILSINDVSLTEGNTTALFTVSLSAASGQIVSVDFGTANGSAGSTDYTSQSGSLTFAPGETTKTISVPILGDLLDEPDETFVVNLSNAINATLADGSGLGTLLDDDATPSLSIDDVSLPESSATAVFTVSLSAASGQTVSVDFATANGSAGSTDYTSQSGSLTFAPGETTKTISVPILGDSVDEPDETFVVNLSNATNATLADGSGLGTLLDNDATPSLAIDDVSITEGNAGQTTATFTVTLSAASGQTVTVDYATADDSAAASDDYSATSGSLSFAPGETTKTVAVAIYGDTTDEDDERFTVQLANAINALMSNNEGLGTILDDDAAPSLTIGDVSVSEGNSGQTSATFTVSLSSASSKTISVDFATADNSAHAPGDYSANSGSLSFAPGETTKTLSVAVNGDVIDESDETFFVNLADVANASLADAQAVGTITDDDTSPKLSISDVTVTEGDFGSTDAVFTLTLSQSGVLPVVVGYSTANNTATAGSDFIATSGTLTFAPGEITKAVTVPVIGDLLDEPNEAFHLNLTSISGAIMTDNLAVGTITDDDPTPTLSVDDVTVTESHSSAVFTITLSAASSQTVTVSYFTASGSAMTSSDYTTTSGSVTFAPGETSKTAAVSVKEDSLDEADENFFVVLSNATNANVGDGTGTATILDNDAAPSLSIKDITVTEGNSGSANATFTVTLSTASGQTVLLDYATTDGTALAGSDYTATSGTLSLVAGLTSKTFTVPILGDLSDEPNETLFVNLSNAINATISDNQAIGTITDNDAAPSLTIDDVSLTEGDSGSTLATFTVSLSAASGQSVAVNYATANSTAVSSSDYDSQAGTLTFAPGETIKTVAIPVTGDTLDEANETYFVNLSNALNATISDSQGLGTITDDDAVPLLSIGDVSVIEGNSGTATATFTVSLSAVSGQSVTVKYATAASSATASTDYTTTSGTLTFAAGVTSQTMSVVVKADALDELDETFFVNLSSPTNASLADSLGIGTIIDDDAPPTLSITDVTVTEGNFGTKTATFTVSLSAASGKAVSVDYATTDNTAFAGTDYIATSGTLTIAAGSKSKTFTVSIKGDNLDEASEKFFVNLSNAINATLSDSQAIGTITDNDPAPLLSINDVTVTEGDASQSLATFTVKLTTISGQSVTVNYSTANSTAVAGSDYTPGSGSITFAPGETSKTVTILVLGDLLDEVNETWFVNLSNAINATISDSKGIGTITDNDAAPTLSINDVTILEGDSGTSAVTFTVTLSAPSSQTVTVQHATANGSAGSADYVSKSGVLSFAAGTITKTISVSVKGDLQHELDETFFIILSSPTNASLADSQAIALILDDDA